eukprot:7375977-Prymnesium_polylepis.1
MRRSLGRRVEAGHLIRGLDGVHLVVRGDESGRRRRRSEECWCLRRPARRGAREQHDTTQRRACALASRCGARIQQRGQVGPLGEAEQRIDRAGQRAQLLLDPLERIVERNICAPAGAVLASPHVLGQLLLRTKPLVRRAYVRGVPRIVRRAFQLAAHEVHLG